MMTPIRLLIAAAVAAAALLVAPPAAGQTAPAATAAPCAYEQCALAVVPRWDALALARGASGQPVGRLGFFWPGDVRPLFEGQALRHARRAVATRRAAAILTDAGLALAASAAVRRSRGLAVGGAALLGASVPLQFVADGELSRAVWWHNARFARPELR